MKSCPGCGQIPSMDDDTVSNGDSTYHRECYRKLVEAIADEPPDALDRIADALERIATKYENPGFSFTGNTFSYDPLAHAETRTGLKTTSGG